MTLKVHMVVHSKVCIIIILTPHNIGLYANFRF